LLLEIDAGFCDSSISILTFCFKKAVKSVFRYIGQTKVNFESLESLFESLKELLFFGV
jgi:hypothetical protein